MKRAFLLFILVTLMVSCQNRKKNEDEIPKNALQKFANGVSKVHEKAKKVDSTMNKFAKDMNEFAEWAEGYESDSVTKN